MSEGIVRELLRRHVPQILGIYLGVSWAIVEFVGFLAERYELSANLVELTMMTLALMIPSIALVAYFHGATGSQRWTRTEKIGIPVNLLVASTVLVAVFSGRDLGSQRRVAPELVERQVTYVGDVSDVALSPDGSLIAYVRQDPSNLVSGRLYVQDIGAGEPLLLSEDIHAEPRWSPDGSEILFQEFSGGLPLNRVARLGGDPVEVYSPLATRHYDMIPGGGYVVTVAYGEDSEDGLYIGNDPATVGFTWQEFREAVQEYGRPPDDDLPDSVTDGTLIDLREYVQGIESLDASPDGRWVAFLAEDSSQTSLLGTVAVDGSAINVFPDLGDVSRPRWAPSSDAIYFLLEEGRGTNLYKLPIDPRSGNQDGSATLVEAGLPPISGWDISESGTRLVYAGGRSRSQLRMATFVPGDTIGQTIHVTNDSYSYHSPAFSPHGDSLVYVKRMSDETGDIYARPVRGSGERRVISGRQLGDGTIGSLSWSPDGRRLAVLFNSTTDTLALTVVDIQTGQQRRVWSEPASEGVRHSARQIPAWSPDGGKLAVAIEPENNILLVDLVGDSTSYLLPGSVVGLTDPVFSPDGESLVFYLDAVYEPELVSERHQPTAPAFRYPGDSTTHSFTRGDTALVSGVWIFSIADRQLTFPTSENWARALLWDSDGSIYTYNAFPPRIMKQSTMGDPPEPYVRLPFQCWGQAAIAPDASAIVCAVDESLTDVWVIDNFDPEIGG